MFLKRNPWIVPVVAVLAMVALYFTFVSSRSSIDQPALLGNWFLFAAIFVVFAVIALIAYRSLRRSGASMDEARPKSR
jgi:uncharacterized membrane protein